jgi:hypothetical protein
MQQATSTSTRPRPSTTPFRLLPDHAQREAPSKQHTPGSPPLTPSRLHAARVTPPDHVATAACDPTESRTARTRLCTPRTPFKAAVESVTAMWTNPRSLPTRSTRLAPHAFLQAVCR